MNIKGKCATISSVFNYPFFCWRFSFRQPKNFSVPLFSSQIYIRTDISDILRHINFFCPLLSPNRSIYTHGYGRHFVYHKKKATFIQCNEIFSIYSPLYLNSLIAYKMRIKHRQSTIGYLISNNLSCSINSFTD